MVQQPTLAEQQQQPPGPEADASSADSSAAAALSYARQVGREFVYIYYMCVNRCPRDLHRFYSAGSYFVHGGREPPGTPADPPIAGQAAIASKIAGLCLADCRTTILMVDALPAPHGCVLVQVCGELSNNAGPMRRFMQSFLLAPLGPRKYFVQNDIFRYQDEVFTTGDAAATAAAAADANGTEPELEPNNEAEAGEDETETGEPPGDAAAPEAAAAATADGAEVEGDPVEEEIQPREAGDESVPAGAEAAAAAPAVADADEPQERRQEQQQQQQQQQHQPQQPSASGGVRKNFAALFLDGAPAMQPRQPQPQPQPQPQQTNGGQQRQHQPEAPEPTAPPSDNNSSSSSLQVFVGNVPPDATEAELAQLFAQFGEVTGARISVPKAVRAGYATGVPYFGFVSFADAASVKAAVMASRLPTANGTQLSVEEKRPAGGGVYRRGGYGGGRGGGRGGGGSAYGGQQQQQPPRR